MHDSSNIELGSIFAYRAERTMYGVSSLTNYNQDLNVERNRRTECFAFREI